jgi:hypothetical protein
LPLVIKILAKENLARKVPFDCNKLVSALEVFMVLLKEAQIFASKPKNVKQCVFLASKIAFEHSQNPSVTLPIIGALLTLRDLNLSQTMAQLARLETKYFKVIEHLAKQHAPDLDTNIRQHVVQKILFGVDLSDESSQQSRQLP